MARQEADREDLIKEAIALLPRAEFQLPDSADLLTAGFRGDEAISLFFWQDPVYQFDQTGALRRAYVEGFLYRSEGTTLARLERIRTATQTTLQRQDLTEHELDQFQRTMTQRLQNLLTWLHTGKVHMLRSVPESVDWQQRLPLALNRILTTTAWLSTTIRARK